MPAMTHPIDLDAVVPLIRRATETHILPRFQKLAAHDIHEKAPGNLVTIADLEAEKALTPELEKLVAGSLVVGEEAVAHDPAILERLAGDDPVWIIDPVDGTMNFTKASPRFAVIIALAQRGEVHAGWIHDPLQNLTVMANAGGGAWLAKPGAARQRLHLRPMPPLDKAEGAAYGRGARRRNFDLLRDSGKVGPLRNINSAGQEYLDMVQGRLDYAIYGRALPWDHAAGVLIHREAGGIAGFLDGRTPDDAPYTPRRHVGLLLMAPNRDAWVAIRDILMAS
jgi:fructose-1,6-bisphosphatase/inositol monophosphatase family enzyme